MSKIHDFGYCHVIDDLLPPAVVEEIDLYFLNNYDYVYGHSGKGSDNGEHTFFFGETCTIDGREYHSSECSVMGFLMEVAKIAFNFKYKTYERSYVNLHPIDHHGGWHKDEGNNGEEKFEDVKPNMYTLLYMSTHDLYDDGGFDIRFPDGEEEYIPYRPGRFVFFRSELWHRGRGAKDRIRTSVAFKSLDLCHVHDNNYEN
jgi:hypothetical protein